MIRRPPRSTLSPSSAASDVYKRQSLPDALKNGGSLLDVFSKNGVNEYKNSKADNSYDAFNEEVATGDPYYIFDRIDEIMNVEPKGDSTNELIEFFGMQLQSLDNAFSEFLTLVAEDDNVKNKYLNEFRNCLLYTSPSPRDRG